MKYQLAPECLSRINEFNSMKALVIKATNDATEMLDVNLIKNLLQQVLFIKSIHNT